MTFAAVAVGVVVAGAGAYAASASADAQAAALDKAGAAQAAQYGQTKAALNKAEATARGDLQPYADTGASANKQLAWSMGLAQPAAAKKTYTAPSTYQAGQSGDPVWEKILGDFNAAHQSKYGIQMNRDWGADGDSQSAYASLSRQYQDQKAAQETPEAEFVGQGAFGALAQPIATNTPYTAEQYKNDPLYTPMVNDLASLQATPGYQFQLEQGLQSVNNSAAAQGSLLSGRQLKGINDYAQGQASTGYQAAWQRSQQAYQQAFSNNQSQQNTQFAQKTQNNNNQFSQMQSMANNGQSAAAGQGGYSMAAGQALAGASSNYGNTQAGLAMAQGQNEANRAQGYANAVTSGLGAGMGYSGGGGNSGGAGTNSGMVNQNNTNALGQQSMGFNNGKGW